MKKLEMALFYPNFYQKFGREAIILAYRKILK